MKISSTGSEATSTSRSWTRGPSTIPRHPNSSPLSREYRCPRRVRSYPYERRLVTEYLRLTPNPPREPTLTTHTYPSTLPTIPSKQSTESPRRAASVWRTSRWARRVTSFRVNTGSTARLAFWSGSRPRTRARCVGTSWWRRKAAAVAGVTMARDERGVRQRSSY